MKLTTEEIRQRILKVLHRIGRPAGAAQVAELLRGWGVDLSERSVRLHLLRLDREGWTRLESRRAGRTLTAKGKTELEQGDVIERLGFVSGQIDELNYRMGFSLRAGATYDAARAAIVPRGKIALVTICSVSLNGILLKEGIPVTSRFGGLLEFRNRLPARFVELLAYGGTTQDPLELFIRAQMTSVRQCEQTGTGLVGASFREFPSVALPAVLKIRDQLRLLGLDGILAVGVPNQPLYGIPVGEGRTGLVVLAGLNPAAALEEAGIAVENRSLAGLLEYRQFPEFRHLNMLTRRGE